MNQFAIQFGGKNMYYAGMENGNITFGFHPDASSMVRRFGNEKLAYDMAKALNRFFDSSAFNAVLVGDGI